MSLERERRPAWRAWLGLRMHLLVCAACRRYGRQTDWIEAAIRRVTRRE